MFGYRAAASDIADDPTFLLGRGILDRAGITEEVDVALTWTPRARLLPAGASAIRSWSKQADRASLWWNVRRSLPPTDARRAVAGQKCVS
jgi:hypothetical protein